MSTLFTYETAHEDFVQASCEAHDDGVDETIDITQRIRKVLPLRIPPLAEKLFKRAMSIIPPDGPRFGCWFCREQSHTMYTCLYRTVAQQWYCGYQNYVCNESMAVKQGISTGSHRMEPARTRVERATSSRGESRESRCGLRFNDTRHPHILQRNRDRGERRQTARAVLALQLAELDIPARVPGVTVIPDDGNSEFSVDVLTPPRESGKE